METKEQRLASLRDARHLAASRLDMADGQLRAACHMLRGPNSDAAAVLVACREIRRAMAHVDAALRDMEEIVGRPG